MLVLFRGISDEVTRKLDVEKANQMWDALKRKDGGASHHRKAKISAAQSKTIIHI